MSGRALILAALSFGSVVLASSAPGGAGGSRIVDRTFSCQTGYLGGVNQVEVWSGKGLRREGDSKRYGFANVSTNLPDGFLAGIGFDAIWVDRRLCRAVQASVPLSRNGLRGGVIGALEKRIDCFTPRTVHIRIRGEFASPTVLRAASPFGRPELRAVGDIRKAEISASTTKGRRIAYASIDTRQKTLLYTARECEED